MHLHERGAEICPYNELVLNRKKWQHWSPVQKLANDTKQPLVSKALEKSDIIILESLKGM